MKENNQKLIKQGSDNKVKNRNFLIKLIDSREFLLILLTSLTLFLAISSRTLAKNAKNVDDKKSQNQQETFTGFYDFNSDPFLVNDNFFKEMQQMQQNIDKIFEQHRQNMNKIFTEASKEKTKGYKKLFGSNPNLERTSISNWEDEQNYYYQLNFSGFKKEDITVAINNNVLNFSLKKSQVEDSKKQKYQSSSNFYYSFSIPQYNQKIDPEIMREDNNIKVKLSKNLTKNN